MKKTNTLIAITAIITINIFSFSVLPVSLHAQRVRMTMEERQEKAELEKQLQELVTQVNSMQVQAQVENNQMRISNEAEEIPQRIDYVFNTDLTEGNTGPDVVALQQFLTLRGMLNMPENAPLGTYDDLTREAVVRYQKANNILPASGEFGPTTRSLVNSQAASENIINITAPMRNDSWLIGAPQKITWNTLSPVELVSIAVTPVAGECEDSSTSTCSEITATPTTIAEEIENTNEFTWEDTGIFEPGNYSISIVGFDTNAQGEPTQVTSAQSGVFVLSTSSEPRLTTTGNLTDARQNVWYSQIINTEGFNNWLQWNVSSGTLPVGLTIDRNANICPLGVTSTVMCSESETYQGVISGIPQMPGTYEFSIKATDGEKSAKKKFTLVVRP